MSRRVDAEGGSGEEEYEDDFEDYEGDDFEEDEAAPAPEPTPVGRSSAPRPPWSVMTLAELDLGDKVAQGAMGAVHGGIWRGQRVAVKTLHDTSAAALAAVEEELLVQAGLSHPNIVRLLGANLTPPKCCIVMERCACSVFERLHLQREELDRRRLVEMAIHVGQAIEHLHTRSPPIVHRDIKSHNVLLDDEGNCKLCDFGLVNSREVTAGTPNYMAPELFLSKPYNASVDIFAFGVLLNEMFAREVPWDGYQPFDIKERVVKGERPPTPRTMPHACEGLLRKLWHQHASLRPKCEQILNTLRAVEQTLPLGKSALGALGCARTFNFDSLDEFASLTTGSRRLNKTA